MTGQVGGQSFSVLAEGERVILRRVGGPREEVDLVPPAAPEPQPATAVGNGAIKPPPPLCPSAVPEGDFIPKGDAPAPGTSPLDASLDELGFLFEEEKERDKS